MIYDVDAVATNAFDLGLRNFCNYEEKTRGGYDL